MPSPELEAARSRGEVALGGCCIFGDHRDAALCCTACGHEYGVSWQHMPAVHAGTILVRRSRLTWRRSLIARHLDPPDVIERMPNGGTRHWYRADRMREVGRALQARGIVLGRGRKRVP